MSPIHSLSYNVTRVRLSMSRLTTQALRDYITERLLRPPAPDPVRAAVTRIAQSRGLLIRLRHLGAVRSMQPPPPHQPPTLRELVALGITIDELRAQDCNVRALVASNVVPRGTEGLRQLHRELGLTLEQVLAGDGIAAIVALADTPKEGREFLRATLGLTDLAKLAPRLTPADFAALKVSLARLTLDQLAKFDANDVQLMLRHHPHPAAWAEEAGLTRALLLRPEWGLGSNLHAVAKRLDWNDKETQSVFSPTSLLH